MDKLERLYLIRDTIDLLYTYGGDFEIVLEILDDEIEKLESKNN